MRATRKTAKMVCRRIALTKFFFFILAISFFSGNAIAQNTRGNPSSNGEKKPAGSEFSELLKKARQEKPNGPLFSTKDIYHIYSASPKKLDPLTTLILRDKAIKRAEALKRLQSPRHRSSVLAAPASMLGPISLGPAYGTLMFQNTLNYSPFWNGAPLPWNGSIGARYLLSAGPLTIPYELALQHRLVMTTVTDSYGNQLVTLTDTGTGYSTQYQIIGRLDGNPPPGTAGPVYGGGYYVSTYYGNIIGTNTSSYPGVFVPAPPFQTTFGYAGDLDTLGPYGRGHTPLNPPGPPPTYMPSVNPPFGGLLVPNPP